MPALEKAMTTDNRAAEICERIAEKNTGVALTSSSSERIATYNSRADGAMECAQAIRSQSAQEPVADAEIRRQLREASAAFTKLQIFLLQHAPLGVQRGNGIEDWAINTMVALDRGAAHPVTTPAAQEPVAWLKEWTNGQGAACERVDLHEECERWLQGMEPKITPLVPAHSVTTTAEQGEKDLRVPGLEHAVKILRANGFDKSALVLERQLEFLADAAALAASEQGES